MLDNVPTGPGMAVHFPLSPRQNEPLEPRGKIDGKDIVYVQEVGTGPGQAVSSYLTGYSNQPGRLRFHG